MTLTSTEPSHTSHDWELRIVFLFADMILSKRQKMVKSIVRTSRKFRLIVIGLRTFSHSQFHLFHPSRLNITPMNTNINSPNHSFVNTTRRMICNHDCLMIGSMALSKQNHIGSSQANRTAALIATRRKMKELMLSLSENEEIHNKYVYLLQTFHLFILYLLPKLR